MRKRLKERVKNAGRMLLIIILAFTLAGCGQTEEKATNASVDGTEADESSGDETEEVKVEAEANTETDAEAKKDTDIEVNEPDEKESSESVSEDAEDVKDEESSEPAADGIRPEFKEAMDSYEAFYDDYCEFMEKYMENPTDVKLLTEYADMVEKSAEMTEKFSAWESGEMSKEELKYYIEVNSRVTQRIVDVTAE